MFDMMKLKDVLVAYKQNFVSKQWGDEKYKWEAVKWFQDNWDVNASDFAEMLTRSLDKTFNLLASNNNFPKGMIVGFAKAAPEEVRAMFIALLTRVRTFLNGWILSRLNLLFSWRSTATEQRSITNTRMPSVPIYGSATQTSIISTNSVR